MTPLAAWALAAVRVLPSAALVPLGALGRWSWPLRAVIALVLASATLVSAPAIGAPWPLALARELTAGVTLAVVLALPFMALDHAASILDVSVERGDAPGTLARWTGAAAFLVARGHHGALRVLAASWEVIPPGGAARDGAWLDAAIRATGDALAGGLVIASSGVIALAALELSLGLVARLSPGARDVAPHLRGVVVMAAVAVSIRVGVEVTMELVARAFSLARGIAA